MFFDDELDYYYACSKCGSPSETCRCDEDFSDSEHVSTKK